VSEGAPFPAFQVCPSCRGDGEQWEESWDPETGEEWTWTEPCENCGGKGHILAPPPQDPTVPWHAEPFWSWDAPTPLPDGKWMSVATHRVSGKTNSLIADSAAEVELLARRALGNT
jgi:hypothetical protein